MKIIHTILIGKSSNKFEVKKNVDFGIKTENIQYQFFTFSIMTNYNSP